MQIKPSRDFQIFPLSGCGNRMPLLLLTHRDNSDVMLMTTRADEN